MKVIVAGGGVAGTVAAIALRRIGAEVEVYEAYPDPAGDIGSFLSLATNGLRGLEAIGCLDEIRDVGVEIARQRMWSGRGKLLGDMPRGRRDGDSMLSLTLRRGRLVERLRDLAVEAGAELHDGHRLTGTEATGAAGVRVRFDRGPDAEADLLVGADGIWSATRRVVDPSAPEPVYGGLCSVSGVSTMPVDRAGPFHMTFGRNGAFVHIPVGDGVVWWTAQVAAPSRPDPDALGLDGLARLYRQERVPSEVIAAATRIQRPTPHHVLPDLAVTRTDRIVLIGDAAHPFGAGQGASMAIEDAVVLAMSLRGASDAGTALAGFDALRRPRVERMVKAARGNRDAKTAGPIAARVRDVMMPFFMRHFYGRATDWLYADDIGRVDPVQVGGTR